MPRFEIVARQPYGTRSVVRDFNDEFDAELEGIALFGDDFVEARPYRKKDVELLPGGAHDRLVRGVKGRWKETNDPYDLTL